MYALEFDNRHDERRMLTGDLPGHLRRKDGAVLVGCKPVDVSKHGLGICFGEKLELGSRLVLGCEGKDILLQVVWRKIDFSSSDYYRYGLSVVDFVDNLEEIFTNASCLILGK